MKSLVPVGAVELIMVGELASVVPLEVAMFLISGVVLDSGLIALYQR